MDGWNVVCVNKAEMRIAWLDTLRGVGIILVVLGHLYVTEARLTYIFSFHMPLFFFISGFFFNEGRYPNLYTALIRGLRTRIVPYLFFCALSPVIIATGDAWMNGTGFFREIAEEGAYLFQIERIYDVAYATGERLEHIENVALWFLPCLFLTETAFTVLHKVTRGERKKLLLALAGISVAAYAESVTVATPLPWTLNGALTGLVFYGCAFIIKEQAGPGLVPAAKRKAAAVSMWAVAMVLSVSLAFLNGRVDMNTNRYGNYFLFYGAAASGIAAYTVMARMLPAARWLMYLGRNSMIIFGLHIPIATVVLAARNAALPSILPLLASSKITSVMSEDIVAVVCAAISFLVLIPCIILMNRYIPFVMGKK